MVGRSVGECRISVKNGKHGGRRVGKKREPEASSLGDGVAGR